MYCKPGLQVVHSKVLEKCSGVYSQLVIKDLDTNQLIILTIFPNWQGIIHSKGEEGYIEFEYVQAGLTKYYCKENNSTDNIYLNTYFVFRQFVQKTITENKDVLI